MTDRIITGKKRKRFVQDEDMITSGYSVLLYFADQGFMVPEQANATKRWALFVYMCADVPESGIYVAAQRNLHQMLHIGSSKDVWVAAQISEPDTWTYRYVFPERPPDSGPITIKPNQTIPNVDSSSPSTLQKFLAWAKAECPAENIMLVLWGHGYGIDYYMPDWLIGRNSSQTDQPPSADPLEAREETKVDEIAATASAGWPSADFTASFGGDRPARTLLKNQQIDKAIRVEAKTQKLAILGFDACAMAMAEVWSELKDSASIGIASQAGLPYLSWPYDRFLSRLLDQPNADPQGVSEMLIDAFKEFYGEHQSEYVTISACDLTKIVDFEKNVRLLARALKKASADSQLREGIFTAVEHCPLYDGQGFIDFGCFCEFLGITMPETQVSKESKNTLDTLKSLVIGNVYSPPNPNKKIAQSMGVSVWMPQWIKDPSAYAIEKDLGEMYLVNGYPDSQFASATGWDKFLAFLRTSSWHAASEI